MSGHSEASAESSRLCELMFASLGKRIPELHKSQSKRWCGLYRAGRTRFAYIMHFKTSGRIQVWSRGQAAIWLGEPTVRYEARNSVESGWAKNFQGRFDVTEASEVEAVSDALYRLSYPGS